MWKKSATKNMTKTTTAFKFSRKAAAIFQMLAKQSRSWTCKVWRRCLLKRRYSYIQNESSIHGHQSDKKNGATFKSTGSNRKKTTANKKKMEIISNGLLFLTILLHFCILKEAAPPNGLSLQQFTLKLQNILIKKN